MILTRSVHSPRERSCSHDHLSHFGYAAYFVQMRSTVKTTKDLQQEFDMNISCDNTYCWRQRFVPLARSNWHRRKRRKRRKDMRASPAVMRAEKPSKCKGRCKQCNCH